MSAVPLPNPRYLLGLHPFDDCVRARPTRPLPSNLIRWASQQPIPPELREQGLKRALCEALARLWPELLARFRRGFWIEQTATGRRIGCLGCIQYDVASDGAIHGMHALPTGEPKSFGFRIDRPLHQWSWISWVAGQAKPAFAGLADAIQTRRLAGLLTDPFPSQVDMLAWDWLVRCLTKLAKRCIDQRKAEQKLLKAFALDPGLMLAFRRSVPRLIRRPNWFLSSFWWNRCVKYRGALLTLQSCAPALLPYYGELLVPGREASTTRYFGQIRLQLAEAGLEDRHWHLLMHDKAKPIWRQWYANRIDSKAQLHRALADWARWRLGEASRVSKGETVES